MLDDTASIKVVLKEGAIKDWAAYVGPGTWTDKQVMEEGNKLSEATARQVAWLGGHDEWTTMEYRN